LSFDLLDCAHYKQNNSTYIPARTVTLYVHVLSQQCNCIKHTDYDTDAPVGLSAPTHLTRVHFYAGRGSAYTSTLTLTTRATSTTVATITIVAYDFNDIYNLYHFFIDHFHQFLQLLQLRPALRYLPLVLQSHFISFVHLGAFWDKCYLIDIHFNLVGLLFLLYFDYVHEKDFYLFDMILHLASLATTLTSTAVCNFNNNNYHFYDCHFDGHVIQVLSQRLFLPSCTQFGQPLLHQRRHRHCDLQLSQRTTCTVSINNFDNLIQSQRLSQSTTTCPTLSTATA